MSCSLNVLFEHASLVGGFNTPEKYESIGMIIPNIWENQSHVPVTTNQISDLVPSVVPSTVLLYQSTH